MMILKRLQPEMTQNWLVLKKKPSEKLHPTHASMKAYVKQNANNDDDDGWQVYLENIGK